MDQLHEIQADCGELQKPGLRGMIPMRRPSLRNAVTRTHSRLEGRTAILIEEVLRIEDEAQHTATATANVIM